MRTVKCKKIKRMIHEYIDGALNPDNKDILLNHISQCEICKKYLENMEKIKFYVAKLKVKEPYYIESKIISKIREQENIKERAGIFNMGLTFKPALSFAIASLIIIGSVFLIYNNISENKLSLNLPEKSPEKIIKTEDINKVRDMKISKTESSIKDENVNIAEKKVIKEKTKIIVSENLKTASELKVETDTVMKSNEPKYSLSKVEGISLKMAKEIATPSTTNPLLERDKAIIGNNMINPLKGEYCIIKTKVDESARVRIIIYDKRIKVVANLIDEQKDPGVYEVKWYGRNSVGDILSEGVYFVYIQIGSQVIKKNVIIIK